MFQLNAKKIFLTYPQSGTIEKEDIINFLRTIPGYMGCCVSKEQHQDGTPHLHAFLECSEPVRTRDQRYFDAFGLHPNVQSARKASDVIKYIRKDNDYINDGELSSGNKKSWRDVVQTTTKDEFFDVIRELSPRDYVLNYQRLVAFSAAHHSKPTTTGSVYSCFILPADLTDWVRSQFCRPRPDRPRALWLASPSRYGKTQWAKSLDTSAVYWNSLVNLDDYPRGGVSTVIFDDFEWANFRHYAKQWLGGQHEFVATDKYRAKRSIIFGGISIFLSNFLIREVESDLNMLQWLSSNVIEIELNKPLY